MAAVVGCEAGVSELPFGQRLAVRLVGQGEARIADGFVDLQRGVPCNFTAIASGSESGVCLPDYAVGLRPESVTSDSCEIPGDGQEVVIVTSRIPEPEAPSWLVVPQESVVLELGPQVGALRGSLGQTGAQFECDQSGYEVPVYAVQATVPFERFPSLIQTTRAEGESLEVEGFQLEDGTFVPMYAFFRGRPCFPARTGEGPRCIPQPHQFRWEPRIFRTPGCDGFLVRLQDEPERYAGPFYDPTQSFRLWTVVGEAADLRPHRIEDGRCLPVPARELPSGQTYRLSELSLTEFPVLEVKGQRIQSFVVPGTHIGLRDLASLNLLYDSELRTYCMPRGGECHPSSMFAIQGVFPVYSDSDCTESLGEGLVAPDPSVRPYSDRGPRLLTLMELGELRISYEPVEYWDAIAVDPDEIFYEDGMQGCIQSPPFFGQQFVWVLQQERRSLELAEMDVRVEAAGSQ